jgi:hypothetical protein
MSDLLLKHSGPRNDDTYDVIADGSVVGRIMFFSATPGGQAWMWAIVPWHQKDRTLTHGYEATREAAVQAFSRSWYRET